MYARERDDFVGCGVERVEVKETVFLGEGGEDGMEVRVLVVRESLRSAEPRFRIERGSSMEERRRVEAEGRGMGEGWNSKDAIGWEDQVVLEKWKCGVLLLAREIDLMEASWAIQAWDIYPFPET